MNASFLIRVGVLAALACAGACKFAELPPLEPDAVAGGVDAPPPDAPDTCEPSTTTCQTSVLTVCDADGVPTNTSCTFGCAVAADRCADLDPSNGLAAYLDQAAAAGPLALTGNAHIDTSARTVTDGSGGGVTVLSDVVVGGPVEIFVISARSMSASNVTVSGTRALAIMVDGNVSIGGTLNLGADFYSPGPGAISSALPCVGSPGIASESGFSGGAGGGFGTAGGAGGAAGSAAGGGAGMTSGTDDIVPLRGGCAGGQNSGGAESPPDGTNAGAGGGALQISTRGTITMAPGCFVVVNGGGAKGYTGSQTILCMSGLLCGAGPGGGSGGAILIEAAALQMDPSAGLVANGGSGHVGFEGRASNGLLSETSAPGTVGAQTHGGDGAASATAAQPGGSLPSGSTSNAGGGGGGAGRIRINLPPGTSFDPVAPIVSPAPSLGLPATR